MPKWTTLVLLILMLTPGVTQASGRIPVDLELVLAVDVSSSMDLDEQRLQRDGYVAALRHPAVLNGFRSGAIGSIALTYFEWGGIHNITTVLDWTLLKSPDDALRASKILAAKPIARAPSTSISAALIAAQKMIEENAYEGARKVIDISGDGPNNTGIAVITARAGVIAHGIEINGLPIMIKKGGFQIDDLDRYYYHCVTGGPSAFVIPVYDKNRLAGTIVKKMLLEIAGQTPTRPPVHLAASQTASPITNTVANTVDCLIGEKQRDDFMRSLGFE